MADEHPRRTGQSKLTAEQRTLRARRAALVRWSKEDPAPQGRRGQAGLMNGFRRQVLEHDPDVTEPELTRRAEALRKAHMADLAFRSSKVRSSELRSGVSGTGDQQ